jgi:hypothetical protein
MSDSSASSRGAVASRQPVAADAMFVDLPSRQTVTLTSLAASAWRRRFAFLSAACVTFAVAAAIIVSLKPRYESEALLIVDPRQTNITNVQSIQDAPATLSDLNFVRSQMQILTSDQLARRVVEDMKLQDDPAFAQPPSSLAALINPLLRLVGRPVRRIRSRKPSSNTNRGWALSATASPSSSGCRSAPGIRHSRSASWTATSRYSRPARSSINGRSLPLLNRGLRASCSPCRRSCWPRRLISRRFCRKAS